MPRKLLFIVNPNAGKKIAAEILHIIRKELPRNIYYQVVTWEDKDHFEEIAGQLLNDDYTDAIAVGGDGTVNAVARTILGSNIRLGIVPVGSGNGLARSLQLSMDIREVIRQIVACRCMAIDYGTVNGQAFFCTAGLGFDAHIGQLFASSSERGLKTYVKIILRELLRYRAGKYLININGLVLKRRAFLITVANAGQYGNDFYIAPLADLQDGLFHVVIFKKFPFYALPGLLIRFLTRKAHLSRFIETISTDRLEIIREKRGSIHFDGEPGSAGREVVFEIKKAALQVIVGDGFKFPLEKNRRVMQGAEG